MNSLRKHFINTILCTLLLTTMSHAQDLQEIQIANDHYAKGQKLQALEEFQNLVKNPRNIPSVHSNYYNLLLETNRFKQAEVYLERLLRTDGRFSYRIDLGILYIKAGEDQKADKYFRNLFKTNESDFNKMKEASEHFVRYNLLKYATATLIQARMASGNNALFALELANLYRIEAKRLEMVNEYLNYVTQTPTNSSYVKNILQMLLTSPEDLKTLEEVLFDRVQKYQDDEVYVDLLIWVNLQEKDFYGAYVQSRAYDKRFKKEQSKTFEIGQIAMSNQDYDNAIRCFMFVSKDFPNSDSFVNAQLGILKATEAKIKKTFPVNRDSIRFLISGYRHFERLYRAQTSVYEAELNVAMLQGYYLDELDSAVTSLVTLIAKQKISSSLTAQAKINLGDIYLLKGEPWESTLLYSQVEKSQHESPLGYEAKLKNAKLWYFKGEFKLAEEHLDILKQATTREIANDAMELSMRIKENTANDSTGKTLKEFAFIELLIYQNKQDEALKRLETFSPAENTHGILDDVYWLEANLLNRKGDFQKALSKLRNILNEFPEDILADDAYFLQGDIYEHQLRNNEKAMEIYRNFLTKFPGSVYAAEARKRYRVLRGDFTEMPNQ